MNEPPQPEPSHGDVHVSGGSDLSQGNVPETSDAELVHRTQKGDAAAFDTLIERYKSRLYGVIFHMINNHEDAADLSQETFLKAFRNILKFRKDANFYTWLYRIGVNTTLNFIRKRKEPPLSLNQLSPETEEEPALKELTSKEGVTAATGLGELREKLNESLQKLSEEHRMVVVLHDIEGLKHQEIAKILGCTEATARSRLYYAHQQLQAWLANYL
jgi:RNA polymerase sigma-70 factor, ECF subfamily